MEPQQKIGDVFIYRHFIWDFDGTLFDTYPTMVRAVQQSLKEFGFDEDYETIMGLMKISVSHTMEQYKQKYGLDQEFRDLASNYRSKLEEQYIVPFTGAEEICAQIVQQGGANYLYTHRGMSAVEFLKKFGLYRYFTDFIIHENGFERKPSPQAIQYLLQKHQLPHKQTIMVGDRDIDILAGKNAGIATCFFENSQYGKIDFADYTITALEQMSQLL